MEQIERIKSILEEEVRSITLKEQELNDLICTRNRYNGLFSSAKTINELLDNKESVLILLKNIDENIYYLMESKINTLESIRNKNNKTEEDKQAIESIKILFSDLQVKYNDLKRKISIYTVSVSQSKDKKINYQKIISRIKYKQFISWHLVEYIKDLLDSKDIDDVTQITFLEYLRIYNQKIYGKAYITSENYKNAVLDMLNFGFEDFHDDTLDYNQEITKKIDLHYSILEYQIDFKKYFEELRKEIPDENDIKLFMTLMIERIQNEINDLISMIKDKEFYMDEDIRKDIISSYQKLLSWYKIFRDECVKIYNVKIEEVPQTNVNLIFSKDINSHPYILKDLKHINNEYLERVLNLLTDLQNGTLMNRNIDRLARFTEFKKLKDDQVRIVIRQISPTLFCIVGAGVKKENLGVLMYETICSRGYPKDKEEYPTLIEEGKEIFEMVKSYINDNKRKGSR